LNRHKGQDGPQEPTACALICAFSSDHIAPSNPAGCQYTRQHSSVTEPARSSRSSKESILTEPSKAGRGGRLRLILQESVAFSPRPSLLQ
jgi:hypothetical protein